MLWLVDSEDPDPLLSRVAAIISPNEAEIVEAKLWTRPALAVPSLARAGNGGLLMAAARLRRVARFAGASIVHAHGHLPGLVAAASSQLPGTVPLIVTRHHNIEHELLGKTVHVQLESWAARRADLVIAVSTAVRDTLVRHGVPRSQIRLVHHGLDWERYVPDADQVRIWRARFEDRPLLVAVGRADPIKDYPTLLDAFELVRRNYPETQLVVAGLGSPQGVEQLTADVRNRSLDRCVELLGWVSEISSLLAAADAFVQASKDESFGLAVLEAMGLGTPVAVTTPGGVRDVVRDAGLALEPGNAPELARRICDILADIPAARSAAAGYISGVRRRFDAANSAKSLLAVYSELA